MKIIYILLSIFTMLFAILSFDGYYFYDDYSYSFYAYQVSSGMYKIGTADIFAHRWGLILPLSLLYTIFGMSDFSTVALPLFSALLSLFLVYKWSNFLPGDAKIAGLIFYGLDFYTLFFSNKLYPDVLLTPLALLISLLLFCRHDQWHSGLLFSFFNMWAILCKELIIYFLPFYLILLIFDLYKKQHYFFWGSAFTSGVFFMVIYLGIYKIYTDDFFYRFHLIQDQHYIASYSYFDKDLYYTFIRISYEPFLMFFNTGLIVPMAGVIGGFLTILIFENKKIRFDFSKPIIFLSVLSITSLLMFWFFTTSFSYYNPIGLFPRHLLFLIPFFAFTSGYFMVKIHSIKYISMIGSVFLFSAWAVWRILDYKVVLLYASLGFWTLSSYLYPYTRRFYLLGFATLLLLHPVYTMTKSTETGYADEKKIVQQYLTEIHSPCIIFTDDKLLTGHLMYYKFNKPEFIEYKDFKEFEQYRKSKKNLYLLVNPYSIDYLRLVNYKMPKFIDAPDEDWTELATRGKVTLYRLKSGS